MQEINLCLVNVYIVQTLNFKYDQKSFFICRNGNYTFGFV